MTEAKIQDKLFEEYRRKNYEPIIPNTYLYGWESDMIAMSKAGLVNEFEIKISKDDFLADFKDTGVKAKRHRELADGTGESSHSDFVKCPNYFWFATPVGLLEEEDIPEYAGLIEIDEDFNEVIKAPRLHTLRINENQLNGLNRGLMLRYWRERLGKKIV